MYKRQKYDRILRLYFEKKKNRRIEYSFNNIINWHNAPVSKNICSAKGAIPACGNSISPPKKAPMYVYEKTEMYSPVHLLAFQQGSGAVPRMWIVCCIFCSKNCTILNDFLFWKIENISLCRIKVHFYFFPPKSPKNHCASERRILYLNATCETNRVYGGPINQDCIPALVLMLFKPNM